MSPCGHRSSTSRPGAATCLDCHTAHLGVGDRARRSPSPGDPTGCLSCHAPGRSAATPGVSPGQLGHPVAEARDSAGAQLTCASCHATHQPRLDRVTPCTQCHEEQALAQTAGGHGATTCGSCHPAHRSAVWEEGEFADYNPRSRPCLACHSDGGDAPQVAAYAHPTPIFDLQGERWTPLAGRPLFAPNGDRLPEGTSGALTCASCHTTHGPVAGKDSLRRDGWRAPCSSCHGEDALVLYRYFHQPERRESIRVAPSTP